MAGRGTEDPRMKSVYVGNLPYGTTEQELKELFAAHGKVFGAKIKTDRDTGRPLGYGFVLLDDEEAAQVIQVMDGFELEGRNLRVNESKERENSSPADRPPRRDFREQRGGFGGEDRPRRSFNRDFDGNGRPPRRDFRDRNPEGDTFAPRPEFRDDSSERDFRPPRRDFREQRGGFGGEDRPRRSFNRDIEGNDRPPRRDFREQREGFGGEDRPRRDFRDRGGFGGEDRPRRDFQRDFDGSERPSREIKREFDGDMTERRPRFDGKRPRRDFGNRQDDGFRPRRKFNGPRRDFRPGRDEDAD